MTAPLFHIDAFTTEVFGGNSAVVVMLAIDDQHAADATWMQHFAAEMNLAETAFVTVANPISPGATFGLRWFTPTVEVRLCGHATLASAHALWDGGYLAADQPVRFTTQVSGELRAHRTADGRIELALPSLAANAAPCDPYILDALGVQQPVFTGYHPNEYRLIVVASEAELRELTPNFALLRDRDESYAVTAPSDDPQFDFVSRYFAPGHGIDEDPVTGSAHCVHGPYWAGRLGKPVVVGKQISARGGIVECEPAGEYVRLRGHAVTVFTGTLR